MNLLLSFQIPMINEVVLIFGIAILVVYLFSKLKFPAIIGFLITGVIAGPYGLKLANDINQVQLLAEIGVILILFSIGLEVSLRKLLENKNAILIGGTLQVILTIMFVSFLVNLLGFAPNQSIFIGFLLSLSSTAIVLNIVQAKGMINSPQGQIILAVLIFQDIIIVPMMLLTPILAGKVESLSMEIISLVAKVIGIILFVYLATKYIMPWLMFKIAKTRLKEIFLLATIFICFSIVYISGILGLSLALGSFLAGLCISDTDYNHQALSNIVPFKDVFSSFFFISVGMLLDIHFFISHIHIIAVIVLAIIIIKIFSGFLSTLALRYPTRIAFSVSFATAQVGEFSFVLAIVGLNYGLIDNNTYQYFLSSTVATMGITPLLFAIAPKISKAISKHTILALVEKKLHTINSEVSSDIKNLELNQHIIIIGYGVNGRNLSLAAKQANIPYVIVETNPETVKKEKKLGEPIIFGDATNQEVFESTNHHKAKICVIAISDPASTRSIIHNIRKHNKDIYIIVRTRFVSEMSDLFKLGANEVIPEEFETAVEIFTRVLNKYLIPKDEIEFFIQNVRSDGYKMFRSISKTTSYTDLKLHIPDFEILTFKIKENSIYLSQSLKDLNLRQKYQINILAVKREEEIISNPIPDFNFLANDILILFGNSENLRKFEKNI